MSLGTVTSDISGYNSLLGATNTSQSTQAKDSLGRDAFLTMLVAQLKNQDPLNPMQGSDFAAQLAQFSSVEQLYNVNDNLKSLQGTVSGKDNSNLLDYIGKKVTSEDNSLTLSNGQLSGGSYSLPSDAATVIDIYDANGIQVAQLTPGEQSAGIHQVQWNGLDATGNQAADGSYTYTVNALGANGGYSPIDTGISGTVTGITYNQGTPYLLMGNQQISPSSVVKIWQDGSSS
jgi:flagellar basal-body rod modification protein FlgD